MTLAPNAQEITMNARRLLPTSVATGALWLASGGSALAADSRPLGQRVATCAHASLGQRDDPPAVTCTDGGVTMTFANFGEMVQHMLSADG